MIAFQLEKNGALLATAGIPGYHVLTCIFTSVNRRPRPGVKPLTEVDVRLGGLDSNESDFAGTHLAWAQESCRPGDSFTVRVLEADQVDAPRTSRRDSDAETAAYRARSAEFYLKEYKRQRKFLDEEIRRLEKSVSKRRAAKKAIRRNPGRRKPRR